MLLSRATAVLSVAALLSQSVAVDAADGGVPGKKKAAAGRKNLFGKVFGKVKEDDKVMTEDEGYWERFLQATVDSVPSASPSEPPTVTVDCLTDVQITCVDSNGNECKSTPKPTNPDECIEPFTYTYTVENIGTTCMELTDWTATYSFDGSTQNIDLLPKVPVDERNICPAETYSVTETIDTDLCQGFEYVMTTEVKANPPFGKSCQATDEYRVKPGADCATEVEITCVDSNGNECKDTPEPTSPEECIEPFTYTYTVENVGTTCMELNSWSATYESDGTAEVIDLLPKVPVDERNICPGETFSVTDTVDTDLCKGYTYKTTTEVNANPPDGNSCQATDDYEVTPEVPCKTVVDITCVDSNGQDCKDTPEPTNPEDCIEPFTYTYTVQNVGPTCMELTEWTAERTFGGTTETTDLLPKVPEDQRNICPPDTFSVTETIDTDLCQGFEYVTTTKVKADPPLGVPCEATDEYRTKPEVECITDVKITCEDAAGIECQEIPPPEVPEDCLKDLTYTYTIENTGTTCMDVTSFSRTLNGEILDLLPLIPEADREICPPDPFYAVTETVTVDFCIGETYTTFVRIEANPPGGDSCEATDEYVLEPEVPCKTEVDITCVDSEGNECKETPEPTTPEECIEPFTYTYTVENVGPTCMELNEWTATYEFDGTAEVIDLLPKVPETERNICPGETFSVTNTVDTDLCKGYTYKTTTEVMANPPNGNSCQATDEYEVTPEATCKTEVEIECEDSNGVECNLIPEPENPEDCVEDITYTYTIDNVGATCMDITTFTRTRNGETVDLSPLLPPGVTEICPGDEPISVTEVEATDLCSGLTFTTTTEVEADPPLGVPCEATDEYSFTPSADCSVQVDITCTDGDGQACEDTAEPTTPEECIEPFTYTYTITNIGPTCMDVQTFSRTITDGTNTDTISLLDKIAGQERICPADAPVSVTETVDTDLCKGLEYKVTTEVTANPPDGNSCEASAEYVVKPEAPCKTEVDITCVDSEGNECKETPEPTTPEECIEPMTYTFTVSNVGPTCMDLTDWTAVREAGGTSQSIDLLPKVPEDQREICPGETFSVTETLDTDLCQGLEYITTTEIKANPPNGNSCEATDEYVVEPEAPCLTEVEITCVDSEGNDCKDTPQPETPEECVEDMTYTYTISNVGPTCMTINKWERNRNGTVVNLLESVDPSDLEVCPGETLQSTETEATDLCHGSVYLTTTEVKATPPNGESCQATDAYIVEPEAPCKTEIVIECEDSNGVECNLIDEPENPEDCIEDITYTYTITNTGPTCMDVNSFERTRERSPGGGSQTESLLDLIPEEERNLCPGEDPIVVRETESSDLCAGLTFTTITKITANPPDGNSCEATDEYAFTPAAGCAVRVDIGCIDSSGQACEDTAEPSTPEECVEAFTYSYVITNIGPSCMTVETFSRTITDGTNTDTRSLLDQIAGQERICPGDAPVTATETVDTDLCLGLEYKTTAEVTANPPNGDSCEASAEYVVKPEAPCEVDISIDCVTAQNAACTSIEEPTNPADCVQDLTYSYTITNDGPTCMEIDSLTRTRSDGTTSTSADLIGLIPGDKIICPGAAPIVVTEVEATQVCTSATYTTTTAVTANPPNGDSCESTDVYDFSVSVAPSAAPSAVPSPMPSAMPSAPPTGGETCNVEAATECSTEAATEAGDGSCNAILPIITRCDKRATFMEMLFNGGDCEQSFNIQEADKFDCTDFNGGPGLSGSYYIHVVPRKDPTGDVYFSGPVEVGSVFPMCPGYPQCSGDRFEADSTVFIYDGNPGEDPVDNPTAPLVQLVNYHTSCSQNLFLKDKYGSTQLVIFFNDEQGLVSCFITATFSITITNAGAAEAAEIVLFTNTVNGNTTDLTDTIQGIQPDEVAVITTQILIDMTVRRDYIVTTEIIGATPSGKQCSDSSTITFTAGNDLEAPPGEIFAGGD